MQPITPLLAHHDYPQTPVQSAIIARAVRHGWRLLMNTANGAILERGADLHAKCYYFHVDQSGRAHC